MEFQTLVEIKTVSSTAKIPIVNDFIPEPTESFICVILRSRGPGVDGIVVENPNTIIVVIEDDYCKYSSVHCIIDSPPHIFRYFNWVILHKGNSHHAFIHHDWEGYHQMN